MVAGVGAGAGNWGPGRCRASHRWCFWDNKITILAIVLEYFVLGGAGSRYCFSVKGSTGNQEVSLCRYGAVTAPGCVQMRGSHA